MKKNKYNDELLAKGSGSKDYGDLPLKLYDFWEVKKRVLKENLEAIRDIHKYKEPKMTIKEYQTIIQKTAVYPKEIGLAYCGLGLTGEAGEVADKIKKLYRDNPELVKYVGKKNDAWKPKGVATLEKAIAKELGDAQWYITAAANEIGYTLEEIMQMNYDKLISRRENNTLHGSGDDR